MNAMSSQIKQTVLIVDDNNENIELLSDLLSSVCTIKSANSGERALEVLMVNPLIDLIILDVMMPGMDGFETCTLLKKEPLTDDIPIIFITVLADDDYEDRGLKLGAVDFITKPFNADLVKSRVFNHLELKRHRDELESLVMQRTRELQCSQKSTLKAKEKLDVSYRKLRDLSEHLRSAREDERTRIARELHDELGQSLTAIKIDLNWLKMKLADSEASVHERVKITESLLDTTVESLRRIYEDLRPGMLDDMGLVSAVSYYIDKFSEQNNILCELVTNQNEMELSDKISINLFRVLQESLTNVSRHASATETKVILYKHKNEILLIIEDNGCGLKKNQDDSIKSYGILGMRERIEILKGTIDVSSDNGEGTRVEVSVPIQLETVAL